MLSTLIVSSLLASLAASQATITSPPVLVECRPALLTIAGGTGPYYISVIPGGEVNAVAIESLPVVQTAGGVTWIVDVAAGRSCLLRPASRLAISDCRS